MKKIITIVMALTLCLSLFAGCMPTGRLNSYTNQLTPGQAEVKPGPDKNPGKDPTEAPTKDTTPAEPEVLTAEKIVDYIEMYNACENGNFGAEYDHSVFYHQVFENPGDMENGVPPIAVVDENDSRYDNCNDPTYSNVYRVTNFATLDELMKNLRQYMTDEMMEGMDMSFLEFDGVLYLVYGSMGYGAYQVSTSDIRLDERDGDSWTAYAPTLYFEENVGDAELRFELQDDGSWKLAEVQLAY